MHETVFIKYLLYFLFYCTIHIKGLLVYFLADAPLWFSALALAFWWLTLQQMSTKLIAGC